MSGDLKKFRGSCGARSSNVSEIPAATTPNISENQALISAAGISNVSEVPAVSQGHEKGPEPSRALCLKSGTAEMRPKAPVELPGYGASKMKRTVRTDTCDLGATPPR